MFFASDVLPDNSLQELGIVVSQLFLNDMPHFIRIDASLIHPFPVQTDSVLVCDKDRYRRCGTIRYVSRDIIKHHVIYIVRDQTCEYTITRCVSTGSDNDF